MDIIQEIIKNIGNLPLPVCKCGCQTFEKVGEGFTNYKEDRNTPIMHDIIQCNNCDKIYTEKEYDKLPRKPKNSL